MATTLLMTLVLQQLEVAPLPSESGQPIVVRVTAADRAPRPGIAIAVELPDGKLQQLGSTDSGGRLHSAPTDPGTYCYRAELDGVLLLAPHHVLPPRRRWLYGLLCVPLGLALLWQQLRGRRRDGSIDRIDAGRGEGAT